jgi:hypothetical protein
MNSGRNENSPPYNGRFGRGIFLCLTPGASILTQSGDIFVFTDNVLTRRTSIFSQKTSILAPKTLILTWRSSILAPRTLILAFTDNTLASSDKTAALEINEKVQSKQGLFRLQIAGHCPANEQIQRNDRAYRTKGNRKGF